MTWQLVNHQRLQVVVSLTLLCVKELNILPYLSLQLLRYLLPPHESVDNNQVISEVILNLGGPQDHSDNIIEHIAVNYECQNEAEEHVDNLDGILASNITITDGGHGVDSPIQRVEVLYLPWLIDDTGIGS